VCTVSGTHRSAVSCRASAPNEIVRSSPDRQRSRRVPAPSVERALLPLTPIGENSIGTVEQLSRRDQLVPVEIARKRQPHLDGLFSEPQAAVRHWAGALSGGAAGAARAVSATPRAANPPGHRIATHLVTFGGNAARPVGNAVRGRTRRRTDVRSLAVLRALGRGASPLHFRLRAEPFLLRVLSVRDRYVGDV
jgi:hypothetical protein